jgi:hypothetical protein
MGTKTGDVTGVEVGAMICTGAEVDNGAWLGTEIGGGSCTGIMLGVGTGAGGPTTGTGGATTITGNGVGKLLIGVDTFVGTETGFAIGARVNSFGSILSPSHPPHSNADDSK